MTSQERSEIQKLTSKPVGSIWGYWPFLLPMLLVIIAVAVHALLFTYLNKHYGEIDILIKHGKNIQLLWDSDLVRQAVLAVSGSFICTFALLMYLARLSHKQAVLLKAAKELGIESSDQRVPNQSRPNSNEASSAIGNRPSP